MRARKEKAAVTGATPSLEFAGSDGSTATFNVHDDDDNDAQEYSKWIAVNGYDADGVHRTSDFKGIRWGETDPPVNDCVETVSLTQDEAFPVVRREAFVWLYPDAWTPVSNVVRFPG